MQITCYYTERLTAGRTTQILQRDINTIHNWVHNNSLTFNISKCKNMLISHKRQGSCDPPDLLLDDLILERVEGFKYLGVILTSGLLWSSHVESICTKSRKLLGLLYHGSYKHAEPSALLQLYHSLVRPHLEYASNVWDPHLQRDIHWDEPVNAHKSTLELCALYKNSPIPSPLPKNSPIPSPLPKSGGSEGLETRLTNKLEVVVACWMYGSANCTINLATKDHCSKNIDSRLEWHNTFD